jgi:Fe-S oxidoreductase
VTDGWRSPEVKEALDLCLACKGCSNDCPVNVDMPTYKAEFLYHHWRHRLRPRSAYAFGLIDRAASVAARTPRLANVLTQSRATASLVKSAAGIAPARAVPRFAQQTFQRWFAERDVRNAERPRVLLWPDTFTNHFHPEVGIAAVDSLEAAGRNVVVPSGHVCCGRPLYDYGFLDLAERYLRRVLDVVRDDVRAGTAVVGLEPSCVAVFKDELGKLLPHDDDAMRLREQSFHYAEFFERERLDVPALDGQALVWGHCHQKATGGMEHDLALLERMGLGADTVSGGCCGLAGSWGFEAAHYELSMACGEEALFPAVRQAEPPTLVVADGFSCRHQILAGTGRNALHLAQVVQRGLAP